MFAYYLLISIEMKQEKEFQSSFQLADDDPEYQTLTKRDVDVQIIYDGRLKYIFININQFFSSLRIF